MYFTIRAFPLLAVFGFIVRFCRSKSFNVVLISSTGLSPVSLESEMAVLSFSDATVIIWSICISFGILGSFGFALYVGGVHVRL